MKKRAQEINGVLEIDLEMGKGTKVLLKLHLKQIFPL